LTGPRGQYASTLRAPAGRRLTQAEVVAEAERLLERQTLGQANTAKT
jgi:heptosyltransferase-1